jgi:hypothetical protein
MSIWTCSTKQRYRPSILRVHLVSISKGWNRCLQLLSVPDELPVSIFPSTIPDLTRGHAHAKQIAQCITGAVAMLL